MPELITTGITLLLGMGFGAAIGAASALAHERGCQAAYYRKRASEVLGSIGAENVDTNRRELDWGDRKPPPGNLNCQCSVTPIGGTEDDR